MDQTTDHFFVLRSVFEKTFWVLSFSKPRSSGPYDHV